MTSHAETIRRLESLVDELGEGAAASEVEYIEAAVDAADCIEKLLQENALLRDELRKYANWMMTCPSVTIKERE